MSNDVHDFVRSEAGLPTSHDVRIERYKRTHTTHYPQDITFPAPLPTGKGTVSDTVEPDGTLSPDRNGQQMLFFPDRYTDHRVVSMSVPAPERNPVFVLPAARVRKEPPPYIPFRKSRLPKFPKGPQSIPKSLRTYADATEDDAIVYEAESKRILYIGDRRTALDIVKDWTFLRISSKSGYEEKIERLRRNGGLRVVFQHTYTMLIGTVAEVDAYAARIGGNVFVRDYTIEPI